MVPLNGLLVAVRGTLSDWLSVRWSELRFAELPAALLVLVVLLTLSLLMLLMRALRARESTGTRVILPAVLSIMQRSSWSATRHVPIVLFVVGVPFFAVAAADPRVTKVLEQVTYPGQRIEILIDGSGSMVLPFDAPRLHPAMNRTFYTAVAAANQFVKLRKDGGNADLIALIQFGNEAYVVTPFTTDYDNVVLSMALIGQPQSWNHFNVFGTTIIQGIDQGLELFKTFDLLKAPGNVMVLFSDGNDGETMFRGRTLRQYMDEARQHDLRVYMVRLGFEKKFGDVQWDELWKSAVEGTGGRFYVAADENSLLRAVNDVNRLSTGRIRVRQYSSASPAFSGYTLMAVGLWLMAGALKFGFPYFSTFP